MASPYAMICIFVNFLLFMIRLVLAFEKRGASCEISETSIIGKIGGVFDESSRVGKEMKIASEMAVNDFYISNACKYKVGLITTDSSGSRDNTSSSAMDLINNQQVNAIILTVHLSITSSAKLTRTIPSISILPIAASPSPYPQTLQLSSHLSTTTQCIAAIVGHFRWRKVTTIYEGSSLDPSPLVAKLADSLDLVNSAIERTHRVDSVDAVEGVLRELQRKGNRVFVLLRGSLEFGKVVFGKAKELGMMEKGFVWIVSEEISSMVESLDAQFVSDNMQGVIGFKTSYVDTTQDYRRFRHNFRKRYGQNYPEEEEYSNPSLYALRAYDATMVIANTMKILQQRNNLKELRKIISSCKVKGLSGDLSFKNGELPNSSTFRVINIVGKSYREIASWSPSLGFSPDPTGKKSTIRGPLNELGTIYWPGGLTRVPKEQSIGSEEKPLKVGVPARGAFDQFVKIVFDQNKNETYVSGFSIDVFKAAVRLLPYQLSYELVPFNGSYDDMIDAVVNKKLDAGVGDTQIMADRYEHVEFLQPYLESGLVMVLPIKQDKTKEQWMRAFKPKMWIPLPVVHVLVSAIVLFIESKDSNKVDFEGVPYYKIPGRVLWFAIYLFWNSHRKSIKSGRSRLITEIWLLVLLIVVVCFMFVICLMDIISRPSFINIENLKNTNATVGCNENSFIAKYLINVLHFQPKNIKEISSISDYPNAFKSSEIAAAFFTKPHAKVFVSKYYDGYIMTEPSISLSGFGIAFPRGSPLVTDIAEAIIKLKQSGNIEEMEKQMFSSSNRSSSLDPTYNPALDVRPLLKFFIILMAISTIIFLIKCADLRGWCSNIVQEITIWDKLAIYTRHTILEPGNSSSKGGAKSLDHRVSKSSRHRNNSSSRRKSARAMNK